ncbi:MAG: TatD family hydrolase [Nitrosomonadales bacterium]|nr:TatD family hydrolase [Nitrosomonadales bacterium]
MPFVDSHCHLNFPELAGNLAEVLANMRHNDVAGALCVSVSLADFPQVLALAEQHPNIYASVGVHPDYEGAPDYEGMGEPDIARLVELAQHPKVVAIGETGLDYFRLKGDLEWQRVRFRNHIRAARECGKPLIVHTRDAAADTLRIMAEEGAAGAGGVMHCFTETWEVAEAALAMGFYISFSGIVTFKNAKQLKDVAQRVPPERMLIETDAPYLAPAPHRGKLNQPAYVKHVAEEIALLRGISVEEAGRYTTENFMRLFGLKTL